jgi:hypothetical protein
MGLHFAQRPFKKTRVRLKAANAGFDALLGLCDIAAGDVRC